jgi:hypothetical protein
MAQPTSFLELPPGIRNVCYSYMTPSTKPDVRPAYETYTDHCLVNGRPRRIRRSFPLLQTGQRRDERRMRQVHAPLHRRLGV